MQAIAVVQIRRKKAHVRKGNSATQTTRLVVARRHSLHRYAPQPTKFFCPIDSRENKAHLPPTAVEEVIALTDLEPEVVEKVESLPLWVQWKFLWILFGCLQTEWIIRKWKGLS